MRSKAVTYDDKPLGEVYDDSQVVVMFQMDRLFPNQTRGEHESRHVEDLTRMVTIPKPCRTARSSTQGRKEQVKRG